MEYMRETLLRPRVLLSAVATAAGQLIWPYLVVGLPAIFFGLEGGITFQIFFLLFFFLPLLIFYVTVCFVVFRINLIGNEKLRSDFVDLTEKEKGKLIGDLF